MHGVGLVVAMVVAIGCGAYVGLAYERLKGRDPMQPRRNAITDARMSKMHVIHDEWHQPDIRVRRRREQ